MDLMKNKSAAGTNDGRVYWRSFEQLADTDDYRELLHREFPDQADGVPLPADALSRRRFLGLVAAAVAMASTTSCRKPFQKILPFSKRPQGMTPGVPDWYASAFVMGGIGTGILVRSNDGRPTKVEGNDLHSSSLGGTDQYMQAEILNIFDQGRSQSPRHQGKSSSWVEFEAFWAGKQEILARERGVGLAFLMPATTSPSLIKMVATAAETFPEATFHTYDPINRDNEVAGSTIAHGTPHVAQTHYDRAEVIVSLDADFTCQGPNAVRHARDFASTRKVSSPADKISRLYVIEANHSTTGTAADHRFRVAAGQIAEVAMALAAELNVGGGVAAACSTHKGKFNRGGKDWAAIIAKDLQAHRGRSLVVAGEGQPPLVHALAHAINDALGNVGEGKPLTYVATTGAVAGGQLDSIRDLAARMEAGSVNTLVSLGSNPVYQAPADLDFAAGLAKVGTKIHLGLWVDETAQACDWHLNQAHDLESWGDIRAHDGTVTIVQPLIAPLFEGRSTLEALSLICGQENKGGHGLVKKLWEEKLGAQGFATAWETALRDGLIAGSAYPSATPTVKLAAIKTAASSHQPSTAPTAEALELVFAQDHGLYDGRYSNNPWMQELPDSVTKLTWDNAALMSKKTAETLDIGNGDFVEISLGERKLEIPVWILPGCADFSVTLKLGYGRRLGDECEVAKGVGFDTYRLRTSAQPNIASGAKLRKTGAEHAFASTQDHGTMEGRALAREGTVEEYKANPGFAPAMSPLAVAARVKSQHNPQSKPVTEKDLNKSLWEERDYSKGPQWAMVIDLNACNGCNACVVACQAENNIPTVGKERVLEGREMHWMRIDRYFGSDIGDEDGLPLTDDPKVIHQPVPCMQCENAPCESVCPVMATTHSPDGLNDMAYNRCIGTRYCSNNCPYKVRRFNYFDFTSQTPEVVKMAMNPDVTVRSRGVMEKCTYCVQRINQAKITARKDGERPVRDGEVTPACGQSCPSQAITFGDMLDPDSAVAKRRAEDHNYAMLSELNVKPRTTYLAKIRNPNTELGNS